MPENKTEERPPQLDNVRDNATQEDLNNARSNVNNNVSLRSTSPHFCQ